MNSQANKYTRKRGKRMDYTSQEITLTDDKLSKYQHTLPGVVFAVKTKFNSF